MEHLDGPQLFDSLYAEDAEGQKLNFMPGVEEMVLVYKEKFTVICQQIFDFGLQKHAERSEEVNSFWEGVNEAKQENKDNGTKKINAFIEYQRKVMSKVFMNVFMNA